MQMRVQVSSRSFTLLGGLLPHKNKKAPPMAERCLQLANGDAFSLFYKKMLLF